MEVFLAQLQQLLDTLEPDPARDSIGWSHEFETAQVALLAAPDDVVRAKILSDWLGSHQPCLFGKIAARAELIEFCFLTSEDLEDSDLHIEAKIQAARRAWWTKGLRAEKHAFVLHAIDDRIAFARPNQHLLSFAARLGGLYLRKPPLDPDAVYVDDLFLRIPGKDDHLFRWRSGVNAFHASGERRWWQDHRIPGGLAFSVNSVGHMVMSSKLEGSLTRLLTELDVAGGVSEIGKVDSLEEALKLAMLTIDNASDAVSGRATWLVGVEEADADVPACPIQLVKKLQGKNHCWYRGTYHTDQTLPSLYFQDAVQRPADVAALQLDFTYLFHNSVDNPDHITMGSGEQIRGGPGTAQDVQLSKAARQWPSVVSLSDFPDLARAIQEDTEKT
jgi:hypothetical protein